MIMSKVRRAGAIGVLAAAALALTANSGAG